MKRILAVDDETEMREIYGSVLEKEGYEVDLAEDGIAAQQKLESSAYNLLITDGDMPGMNGFELARWSREYKPNLPILMVSAGSYNKEAIKGVVDKFLKKPLDLGELIRSVESLSGGQDE